MVATAASSDLLTCRSCSRTFGNPGALQTHQGKGCKDAKKSSDHDLDALRVRVARKKAERAKRAEPPEITPTSSATASHEALLPPLQSSLPPQPLPYLDLPETDTVPTPTVDSPPETAPLPTPELPARRQRRLPAKFKDFLPTGISRRLFPTSVPPPPPPPDLPPSPKRPARHVRFSLPKWETFPTKFNTYRVYRQRPSHIPDLDKDENLVLPTAEPRVSEQRRQKATSGRTRRLLDATVKPFPNFSAFLLGMHHCSSNTKTDGDFVRLQKIFSNPHFRSDDVTTSSFSLKRTEAALLDEDRNPKNPTHTGDGWIQKPVTIKIPPLEKAPLIDFEVGGMFYRKITSVCRQALEADDALERFHFHPFRHFWLPHGPDGAEERIFDEVYTSDAMLEEEERLNAKPPETNNATGQPCDRERVVLALMLGSDATHLADFGQAKAWPVYLYYGNQSKYDRCRPATSAAEHIAFIPSLPDRIQDFIRSHVGMGASKPIITHCRRELFHAVWTLILDDDFLEAYSHGIVIKCGDGVERRFYLRIFTYSADYPEKVLIATIRDMGGCPCPRCLVTKEDIYKMGMKIDMRHRITLVRKDDHRYRSLVALANKYVYAEDNSQGVGSAGIERMLKPQSWVPTVNAFSSRITPIDDDFSVFRILVNDFLHEFELGDWKTAFTQLMRLLHGLGIAKVHEFDARFRQIGPFGRDTIRPFSQDVSEMKKLAARDFEDILQCVIPALEGLLPGPHNDQVLELLFVVCDVHALSKLRMHTERSLTLLKTNIATYGTLMRRFGRKTCSELTAKELPKEAAKRARRQGAKAASGIASTSAATGSKPAQKPYNFARYKYHAIGDFPDTIRQTGTLDNTSTQTTEREHRTTKSSYRMGSKNSTYLKQITSRNRRRIQQRVNSLLGIRKTSTPLPWIAPTERYQMAKDPRKAILIARWANTQGDNATAQTAYNDLKDFLLSQLRPDRDPSNTPTEVDRLRIIIKNNRLVRHTHARFNYTSYDVRRAQDSISMRTARSDVMVAAAGDQRDEHPFWYGRIMGIYHVLVQDLEADLVCWKRVDLLWVRWFVWDKTRVGGFKQRRLDRVRFALPTDKITPFGIIHPSSVIRACHIIPAFAHGRISGSADWTYYYVNRFVDRDMYMRYRGWGVGHLDAKTRCSILQEDPVADSEADLESNGDTTAPSDPNDNDDDDDENTMSDESGSSEEEADMGDGPDEAAAAFLDGFGSSTGTNDGAHRFDDGDTAGRLDSRGGVSGVDDERNSESGEDGDASEDSESDGGTDTGSVDVAYDQ